MLLELDARRCALTPGRRCSDSARAHRGGRLTRAIDSALYAPDDRILLNGLPGRAVNILRG